MVVSAHQCRQASGPLEATVTLPGSKSITNRALILAGLADGTSILRGLLFAEDTRLMIAALGELGIAITLDEASCRAEVTGCGGSVPASEAELACGNSGTTMRFCTALASLGYGRFHLDGVARMRQRPIGALVSALRTLGGRVEFLGLEDYPPLVVHADGLRGGTVTFCSPESSQFVSALLMVSPFARGDVLIDVTGEVPSVPYLAMTTAMMERFGVSVIEEYKPSGAKFIVASTQRYTATTYDIEPDASNATYFLAAAAVAGGTVTVTGLTPDSLQGDVGFVDVLGQMGCRVERKRDGLTVTGPPDGASLTGVDVDLNMMPDTVPTLAVLSLFADGATNIRNVANLRVKETDRLAALTSELTKLGATVVERADGLHITPPERVKPTTIETYDDHRMAMSFALAGLRCPGVLITNPGCCAKTLPDFFERFEAML